MRLLITGGAGFIGSAVIRHCLTQTEHQVLNVDKLTYAGCLDNIAKCLPHRGYQFRQIDISDATRISEAIAEFDPDAIMHLAAESHVDRSLDRPDDFIKANIVGTYALLQGALKHFAQLSSERQEKFRFHHVSTDEVFGDLGEGGLFSELSPYAPNSPYSASKASSDMLVRAWHHTFGLPVVISNCSNNYGPYQFPEKLIPVTILAALEGRQIPIYGRGDNVRDWLYVEDHVAALMTVLTNGRIGESYNVGAQNEMTNLELVRLICQAFDELFPESRHRPHQDLITFVADRPGHDRRYAIDASKIKTELGWSPTTTISEGVFRTVRWYFDNEWWWRAALARRPDVRLGGGS